MKQGYIPLVSLLITKLVHGVTISPNSPDPFVTVTMTEDTRTGGDFSYENGIVDGKFQVSNDANNPLNNWYVLPLI